jgi:lipid-binding SYLF domain-containing protein
MASAELSALEKDVKKAIETLKVLTKAKKTHLVGKSQRLPPEELEQCRAVAFFQSTKAGFIASVVSGHGFLLKKVHDSPSGWSAPLLFDLKSVGIGFSAGFSTAEACLVLDTDHAVHSFLHTQVSLDSEMTISLGPAGRKMHSSELNVTHPNDTFNGEMYAVAHGAMIDLSFQGVKISVKDAAMKKLYGEGVSNADVLDGKVPQLPEVVPLLEDLKALIKSTPVY